MIYNFRGYHAWLSNMFECEVEFLGHKFKSVENAYMYAKNPTDKDWLEKCLIMSPGDVKKVSKLINIRSDWEDVKLFIMYNLLVQKFSKEPFKSKLIETKNENIIEGNYWGDRFWGVDLKQNPNIGENWLGRLIMDIRNKIKKGKL